MRRKDYLFIIILVLLGYLAVELPVSFLAWKKHWGTTLWIFEDSGKTVHFDPIRGYKLTTVPSRFARITGGKIEYVGSVRGNAQGFADRHDFTVKRQNKKKRIAVFGDSFSVAQFLETNWPDRAEELDKAFTFLNFSIDGGGIANWWSIIDKFVEKEGYELDGVVFAVVPGDLYRTFSIAEHRGYQNHMFGRLLSWEDEYPATANEAKSVLRQSPGLIVSTEEFNQCLSGEWPASLKWQFRFYLFKVAASFLRGVSNSALESQFDPPVTHKAREQLVDNVRNFLRKNRSPTYVFYIPDRDTLLGEWEVGEWFKQDARIFAKKIGAVFVDGSKIYAGLSKKDIRGMFFPHDGHWNQRGSDAFARFMLSSIKTRR